MNILITIQFSAHVHLFRNAIPRLRAEGHEVRVCARRKGINIELLEAYDIEHTVLCDEPDGWLDLARTQLTYEYRVLREALRFDADVITASQGMTAAHVSAVTGAESHIFLDTETDISKANALFTPFADKIYTPRYQRSDWGDKQVRYDSFHELAYLHPNTFDPDPSTLSARGVDPDEPYFVVRFDAFHAAHDIGKRGFSEDAKRDLIESLDERGEVYISHEGGLPEEWSEYALPAPPHEFHHLLYYADAFVGEVATTACEAAVLGTPTVRVSPFAGEDDLSYLVELEREYDLARSFPVEREREAIATVRDLADDSETTEIWRRRRQDLLDDKLDMTEFMVSALTGSETTRASTTPRT